MPIDGLTPEQQAMFDSRPPELRQSWGELPLVQLQRVLNNLIARLPYDQSYREALAATQKRLAALNAAQPSGQAASGQGFNFGPQSLVAILAGVLGVSAATAAALLYHQNPHRYHCPIGLLVGALDGLVDGDTTIRRSQQNGRVEVTVSQLNEEERWYPLLTITFVENAAESVVEVEMGALQAQGVLSAASELGRTVGAVGSQLFRAGRRGGIGGVLKSLLGSADQLVEMFSEQVLGRVEDLLVKMRVWRLIDEAAEPCEEAYYQTLDAKAKAERQGLLEAQLKEAMKRCAGCNVKFEGEERVCLKCGMPR